MANKNKGKELHRQDQTADVVIRREEIIEEANHGGAWKIAYADFITAMMAFFLVLWLINTTTQAQRQGLAEFFSPKSDLSHGSSGIGKPFGGETPFSSGSLISDRGAVQVLVGNQPVTRVSSGTPGRSDLGKSANNAESAAQIQRENAEQALLEQAAAQIRTAILGNKVLAAYADQISVSVTPQGLRIQIFDKNKRPMFTSGSAVPEQWLKNILEKISPIIASLKDNISISGYTDATPYIDKNLSNWGLSAERANAARFILVNSAFPEKYIREISGFADRDLLIPSQPDNAANRRIVILVHRKEPPPPNVGEVPVSMAQTLAQTSVVPNAFSSVPGFSLTPGTP